MLSRTQWLLLTLLVVGIGAVFYLDLHHQLTIASIKAHRLELQTLVSLYPLRAGVAFFLLYAALIALSVPASAGLTVAAGFLFGGIFGALVSIAAATLGASLIFLLVRYVFRDLFELHATARIRALSIGIEHKGFVPLILIRALPFIPFSIVNIAAGLSRMRLRDFALATFLGIIPETIVFALAGTRLNEINGFEDVLSRETILTICALVIVIGIPFIYVMWKDAKRALPRIDR